MSTTQECQKDTFFNSAINTKLMEHGRILKILHVADIEDIQEMNNVEEYINNTCF